MGCLRPWGVRLMSQPTCTTALTRILLNRSRTQPSISSTLSAESGLPVVLQKLTTVRVVCNSDLELSRGPMCISPAAKRALLGPFSDKAGFTSSAIPRRHLHRILLSRLSMPCDSRLWSRSPHLYSGFCKLSGRVVCVCLSVFRSPSGVPDSVGTAV